MVVARGKQRGIERDARNVICLKVYSSFNKQHAYIRYMSALTAFPVFLLEQQMTRRQDASGNSGVEKKLQHKL